MKNRFSSLDILAIVPELKAKICTGWRVNQVYDCDHKTYIFKLNKSIIKMKKDDDPVNVNEETANKMSLIIESGLRIHTTDFDWPKSHAPGHFAIKLRKLIRNKRIENITQVGIDRLVDIQFGSSLAANHLIVELYDRGNLILTDNNYSIIHILRWRKATENQAEGDQKDSENFRVGQIYPLHMFRKSENLEEMNEKRIMELLNGAKILLGRNQNYKKRNRVKESDDGSLSINLKDLFNPYVVYGSSLLEDRLIAHVFDDDRNVKKAVILIPMDSSGCLDQEKVKEYASLIKKALDDADNIIRKVKSRNMSPGYLVQKKEVATVQQKNGPANKKGESKNTAENKLVATNIDLFPILSCAMRKVNQESGLDIQEYESFDKAADVYFCNLESQKLDTKALAAEKEACKKLNNLKIAQEKRLDDLGRIQKEDEEKAQLIELNCDKVEDALLIIRSMLANQMSWSDIWETIKEAQSMNDPIASLITQVKFSRNEFTMKLSNPYEDSEDENQKEVKAKNKKSNNQEGKPRFKNVDIDIGLSAHANARRFFVKRRTAVDKEKKTIEVSKKAFKNVERQTKERLKEVVVTANITKARKRYWFENFFWFISSDGLLVVAGRDAEQNELLVKRYMKNNDIYVHADLHGAASVIIKNETSDPVPPKTLNEAGNMATCYSSAWDSKIATTSWWVYPKQVSKTAPSGEYLTLGAFIIRGKKNFLPLSNLVLGFGFLFRLEEESIERRHKSRLAKIQDIKSNTNGGLSVGFPADPSDSEEGEQEVIGCESVDSEQEDKPSFENANQKIVDDAVESEKTEEVPYLDDEDDDMDEDNKVSEHKLVDTLSEFPQPDDILLYGIPMCGPYTAFQNFKYKVKVVPGANKRGKAAKACLGMFLHDKRATQREKDLLRAVKDQDYARNIPNKVKISATNMKALTKRRPKKSEVRLPRS